MYQAGGIYTNDLRRCIAILLSADESSLHSVSCIIDAAGEQ